MRYEIMFKGMKFVDEDRETAKSRTRQILQVYSDKLKKE